MIRKKKIFRYYILLLLLTSFGLPLPVAAQQPKQPVKPVAKDTKEEVEEVPFYNGTSVSVDLYGVGSKLFGGDFLSSEVAVEVDLKHIFFPIVEVGYGTTSTTDDTYDIHYKSSAPYARIGVNFNTMWKKKSNSYIYAGLRYGFTSFKYDVQSPPLEDAIWGGEVPFAQDGVSSRSQWLEFLVGVKAEIFKNFQMGWSVRYKSRLNAKESLYSTPWYIPGFGSNKSSTIGVTYNLIYQLPF